MKFVSFDFFQEFESLKDHFSNGNFTQLALKDLEEDVILDSDYVFFNPNDNESLKNFYLNLRKISGNKPLIVKKKFDSKLVDIISADRKTFFFKSLNEIDNFLSELNPNEESLDYYPIPLNIMMFLNESPVDLFLKISQEKLIKIVRKGAEEIQETLAKYEKKSCRLLYVKGEDFPKILDVFSQKEERLDVRKVPEDFQKVFNKDVFEFVYFSLHTIGLNEDTFRTTNRLVRNTIHLVKGSKNTKLRDIWKSYCKNKNYLIEHSLILSHIVAGAAKHFSRGQSLADKLLMAAMFHDIALTDDNIAKTYGTSMEGQRYGYKEMEEFESHHEMACKLLESMNGVPSDVIVIVNQHHEKYDGSGFPRGLVGKNINPAAALFIVCHEFVQELYLSGFSLSARNKLLRDLEDKYSEGYFLQAISALRSSFDENRNSEPSRLVS